MSPPSTATASFTSIASSSNPDIGHCACVPAARFQKALLDALVELGCKYEGAVPSFIGIDVPADVELTSATELLIQSGLEWEHADPTYEEIYGSQV